MKRAHCLLLSLGLLLGAACAHPRPPTRTAPITRTSTTIDTSTVVGEVPGGGEDVDFEMEAEHALEAELMDVDDATEVAPILAVTGTVTFDIPMADHPLVDKWVGYLTRRGNKWYRRWLSRSTRWVPIFQPILEEYGLPKDLVFLAMIESGFSTSAYSWAQAAGPWQFIASSGRRFGLRIDFWLDERRDFELSTHAAAKYLSFLHREFDDWYLAWAAYNAGEARLRRAIRRAGTRDFWKISGRRHVVRETKHYVPKLLAAARVSKSPDRYGIDDVAYETPLAWQTYTTTVSLHLNEMARACGKDVDEEALKMLNPSLRRAITPPGMPFKLRVPTGTLERCVRGLRWIPESERTVFRHHRVGKRETLAAIAKRYHTSVEAIRAANKLKAAEVHVHDDLVVPVPFVREGAIPIVVAPRGPYGGGEFMPGGVRTIAHRVRRGESLWKISRKYRVSIQKLRRWNGLGRRSLLRIGQIIRIYAGRGPRS